jgi:arylsulfatase A-like enzyme
MFSGNSRTEEDKGTYVTDLFKREALGFVRAHSSGDQPFLLYLCFTAPHGASSFGPLTKDHEFKENVGVQAPEKFVALYHGKTKNDKFARYFGAVTCMDEAIGDLLATLKERGQENNTLIFFLSDNGGAGNDGNAPLKGTKSTMWEGGLRVPFIAWWPGHFPAGKITDEFLTSLELFPTLCAATGAKPPPEIKLDGFDMAPVLRGDKQSPRQEMFWQRRNDKAARVGNWKWIDGARDGKGGGLFDLSTDIGETHDLSNEKRDVLVMVKARFAAWRKEMDESEPRGPFRDY